MAGFKRIRAKTLIQRMHRDKKNIHIIYLVTDILLIAFSFYLPYCLKYNRGFIFSYNLPYFKEYGFLFVLWGLALISFLHNDRLFSTDRSLTILQEAWLVTKCVFFSSVLAALAIFLLQLKIFSRLVFSGAAILLVLNLSLWRVIKRTLVRYLILRGDNNINVLIIGAGKAGRALASEIESHPYLGLKIAGFLDDEKSGSVLNYKVLGKIDKLDCVISEHFVDEVYVTIPSERQKVAQILLQVMRLNKTARVLADNFTLFSSLAPEQSNGKEPQNFAFPFGQLRLANIGSIPLISYIDSGPHGTDGALKRFVDILLSGICLIILSPLFLLISFLIKLDTPGPVFYKAIRCAKKGKLFELYKFRSMVTNADNYKEALRYRSEVKGPVFKIRNDPRVTPVGRLLRRYSLDELPQLINVIKGEMSLVGPRPPTPDEVEKYNIWQRHRLDVRPGITCLWQVRGRSDLSFYKWMKWDLWYIDNWSFGLDLWILLQTIPAVITGKGAY